MEITLHREDLKDEFKDVSTRQTSFHMFKPEVQEIVKKVGRAVFRDWNGNYPSYNAIFEGL